MAIRVPSHLYRNRHGGFYFRFALPSDLREFSGRSEVRLSLGTEARQEAIIAALPLIADLNRLTADLRKMDQTENLPPDYFSMWREEVRKRAKLTAELAISQNELQDAQLELAASVPRLRAQTTVRHAYDKGQLTGKRQLEERLAFPWLPERTTPISELIAAYLRHFDFRARGGRKKPIGAKTREGYEVDLRLFVTIMGDVKIGAITRDLAGIYFDLLRQLPPNISRAAKYRGKSIPVIIAMGDEPQSEVNSSKKMERLSGMFKWALDEKRKWGIDANPFLGFGQDGEAGVKRRPFTHHEMLALLTHPDFVNHRFASHYSFWLIPLGIFTGARLGELCQLDIKDFVAVDGVECIDINDLEAPALDENGEAIQGNRKKRVKTKNAKRLVPIHPELIRLGLLRFVEAGRAAKQVYLFPELSRTRRDGPAHAASNWFQRFRAKVGITGKQETVFHSFRHGFITTLLDGGISEQAVAPVTGHEAKLITGQVYWNKKDATKRKPTVDAFTLAPELLALIPAVEAVTLTKAPGRKPGKPKGPLSG